MRSASIRVVNDERSKVEKRNALLNNLIRFNTPILGAPDYSSFVIVAERNGELIGGLSGYSLYDWLCVEVLWVAEQERRHGIGRALMKEAEELALERRCTGIHLDTFDFQGPGFYEKLGYQRYGQLPNWPGGHQRLSYCKTIDALRDT